MNAREVIDMEVWRNKKSLQKQSDDHSIFLLIAIWCACAGLCVAAIWLVLAIAR